MLTQFNLQAAHPSWHACLTSALEQMDSAYLKALYTSKDWLPNHLQIFNAFSLPLNKTNYVLLGESPYPRVQSANGFAFWDASVADIWSATGLSKAVNRATSLRNIIKMLLLADGRLNAGLTSQTAIAALDKTGLVQTNTEFFQNFLKNGFLLLNATLVFRPHQVKQDAQAWQPFLKTMLSYLHKARPSAELILLGSIASKIDALIKDLNVKKLYAVHPYNISFIQDPDIISFFQVFRLLAANS